MAPSIQVSFKDSDIAMMQDGEIAAMVRDIKKSGPDAALAHVQTMPAGVNVNVANAPKANKVHEVMKLLDQDPELAAMAQDLKAHGPAAAMKYAKDAALMKRLELIFSGLPQANMQQVKELGGLGALDETYGETVVEKEWPHPRLLGGGEGKKFGIISFCICFWCFPCGLLAICFPCDPA